MHKEFVFTRKISIFLGHDMLIMPEQMHQNLSSQINSSEFLTYCGIVYNGWYGNCIQRNHSSTAAVFVNIIFSYLYISTISLFMESIILQIIAIWWPAPLLQPTNTTLDVRGDSTCTVPNRWFLLKSIATKCSIYSNEQI